jgi:hypothetical protein
VSACSIFGERQGREPNSVQPEARVKTSGLMQGLFGAALRAEASTPQPEIGLGRLPRSLS